MIFAVNGTLMRGFPLNTNLLKVGAKFLQDAKTAPIYRIWSIHDQYPAMMRVGNDGKSILLELWDISNDGLIEVLQNEPPGLVLGRIRLNNNKVVLGILSESFILEGSKEITEWGGWRSYSKHIRMTKNDIT